MKLSDLTPHKDYAFKGLECSFIVREPILSKEGRVTLSDGGDFCFETYNQLYNFKVVDEHERLVIIDRFKQRCSNIAYISMSSNNNPIFMLDVVFFPYKENFGKIEIVVGDKIKDTLIKKDLIKENEDYYTSFVERFILSDGFKKCFAYGKGYLLEDKGRDADQVEPQFQNDDFDSDDDEEEAKNSEVIVKTKSLIIYGKDLTLYVSIRNEGENEVAVAEKIVVGKTKNIPPMFLGYGEVRFVRESSYISGKVKDILSERSEYLDVWNEYSKLEGKILFDRVRKIGIIQHKKMPDGIGYIINLTNTEITGLLNTGDHLMFSESLPPYLEKTELTWEEYREALKVREDKQISFAEIIQIDKATNSLYVKSEYVPNLPYLSFSISGDSKQIERREKARKAISAGQSAMPTLGLILEGKSAGSIDNVSATRKIHHIPALSAFVKDKIFKHNPTDTQVSAIDIALNTPDIAIIQGPPGTGKTTVITAIVERLNELFDKRENIRGQVLATSFQHDAVENIIQRLSINSLPTVKYGKRGKQSDNDTSMERIIDEWCDETATKIRQKNLQLIQLEEQKRFSRLFEIYEMSPSNTNALEFLKCAKSFAVSTEIAGQIEEIIDSLNISKEFDSADIMKLVRKIRVTESGFYDDGEETALALYDKLESVLDKNDERNREILDTLKTAAQTSGEPSKELLKKLKQIRRILLERLIPSPAYRTEKPRTDIIEIYRNIKNGARKPQNAADSVIIDFLSEIENNPVSVHKALADYSFVFSASTQQSVGKDIFKAKNKDVTYDTVIVDEAARANPGDLMIPLTQAKRRIILVGDHRQLPHIYDEEIIERLRTENEDFNMANIKISMFEQLMISAKKLERYDGIRRTITLDAQYRMHPLLGDFVNDNFYKPHGESFGSPLDGKYFQQNLFKSPAVWIDVPFIKGNEEKYGTSRRRFAEVSVIVKKIKEMINSENGKDLSFGVISFYSAQVAAIKHALGDKLGEKVRVGSVDAFQGMEFDVIFLSIVRTRKNMQQILPANSDDTPGTKYFGFMTSENRLCVAMSRQKRVLIAVGDSNMFKGEIAEKCVPAMKNYYKLCEANGGVVNA